jgi:hypothetical protein
MQGRAVTEVREVFLSPDNKGLTRQPTYGTAGVRVSRYFIHLSVRLENINFAQAFQSQRHAGPSPVETVLVIESIYVDFEIGELGVQNFLIFKICFFSPHCPLRCTFRAAFAIHGLFFWRYFM